MVIRPLNPSGPPLLDFFSRETIRIALTHAALDDFPTYACDIQNTYLQALSSEKHYVVCCIEFELENVDKHAIIVHAFYGGKSAGADYWRHVHSAIEEMEFYHKKLTLTSGSDLT